MERKLERQVWKRKRRRRRRKLVGDVGFERIVWKGRLGSRL